MGPNSGRNRRARALRRLAVAAGLVMMASTVHSQAVYRCESQGKVSYSHEPCVGAKAVNTTPTQGLDKSSGKSRKGADVRKAEIDKTMSEAIRPITGLDHEQRQTLHRRFKLPHAAKLECAVLDTRLASHEADERAAGSPKDLQTAQQSLFESRKRFRDLRC